ncbi:MAG TPA: Clp protease N-terminal domain-containing protein [Kribbella sp.]
MDSPALNTQALIDVVAERAGSEDPLVRLETAVTFADLAGKAADAMVDHYVEVARAAELSWTVIGDRLGVSKQAVRQRFSARLGLVGGPSGEPAAIAPRLVSCLEAAQAAADAEDSVPGTQHLLLGLLRVGVAANVLDRLGVTRERVRDAATRLFEPTSGGDGPRVVGDGEADAAVSGARRFAANRGQNLARTEHLLFMLVLDPGSAALRVLNDLGVDPARIREELNDVIPPPPRPGRRRGKTRGDGRACSFCGCADAHRPMVTGPGVWICGECVALSTEILSAGQQGTAVHKPPGRLLG